MINIFIKHKSIVYLHSNALRCAHNGRRIGCKKRESRKAFELRRQLNPHVGRRCAPDDRRSSAARCTDAQRPYNIRLTCICAFADAHSGGKVGAKVA
ncbi:MAG: hypothetical protein ACTTH7_01570 [Treponema sp.]